VVVIGPDDRARDQAMVKDLAKGDQRAVPIGLVGSALLELGCPLVRSSISTSPGN